MNEGILVQLFQIVYFVLFFACLAVGMLALFSPRLFTRMATLSAQWVIDVDKYLLQYSRLLGAVGVSTAAFLAYRYFGA